MLDVWWSWWGKSARGTQARSWILVRSRLNSTIWAPNLIVVQCDNVAHCGERLHSGHNDAEPGTLAFLGTGLIGVARRPFV